MKKKKLLTGLFALALVGVVGVGGSLAWFTDTEEATNNLTLTHVNITLDEEKWIEGQNKVVPGDTLEKDPKVSLVSGSVDAWVRIKPLTIIASKDNHVIDTISLNTMDKLDEFKITLNNGWSLNEADGYFYYNIPLTGESSTTTLFDSFTIPTSWGNSYNGATVTLDVQAEAIQREHTGDTCESAFSAANGVIEDYETTE